MVGHLLQTSHGQKYVLTIVDYMLKWPEAIPLKVEESEAFVDVLLQFFMRVKLPNKILMDKGSNFVSKTMIEFNRMTVVTLIMTKHLSPSNGQPDREIQWHPEGNA